MVGWSDKVGSIPFEGTQEIEVRTEDTDELIGRYQMIWKISVKSIRDTIRKHATTEQGGDAFNGRATYENGIKLLHGDEEPSIRNYYNPGDDDTIFIILGGQILEVDGAQYLLEDEDPQTDHQEYNYLGGWIELIRSKKTTRTSLNAPAATGSCRLATVHEGYRYPAGRGRD